MLLSHPPKRYLLELRNATKNADNTYTWTFTERNLARPKKIRIGPVSVTTDVHCRNVVITSDSFLDSTAPYVNRSDEQKQVMCVVHGECFTTPPVEGAGEATQSSASGSDQSIIDIGANLVAWLDYAPSRTFDSSFTSSSVGGLPVMYIYNRATTHSDLILTTAYGTGLSLNNMGSTLSIHRAGSWESTVDSQPFPVSMVSEEFHVHSIVKLLDTAWTYFWDLHMNKTLMWGSNPAVLSYYDETDTQQSVSGITMIPLRNYLLSVARVSDGNGGYQFEYRVENLDDSTEAVQTATTTGAGQSLQANPQTWRFGHASTHFNHHMGPFLFVNGTVASDQENCRAWLRAAFGSSATETTSASTNANQWYQLYDTRKTVIEMNQPSKVLRKVTGRFEDHNGAQIEPKDAIIHMEILRN
jgi:hypothetical protein